MKLTKRLHSFAGIAVVLVLLILIIGPHHIIQGAQQTYNKWMLLTMILDKIERFYVDQKQSDTLLDAAIEGVLSSLDPYSSYISPKEMEERRRQYNPYVGLGLKYLKFDGKLHVVSVMQNGPALESGIQIGDQILNIDGYPVKDLEASAIRNHISGTRDSTVTLLVEKGPNNNQVLITLRQRPITPTTVPCSVLLNSQTGYIKLTHFAPSSPQELDRHVARLKKGGMQNLVLDLRNNRGGEFNAGIQVVDRFIQGNRLICYTRGRSTSSKADYVASDIPTLEPMPLILLVNGATASDAEILAGAVQDWDRGLILGEKTFGKAMVQSEFKFQNGGALLLTTARYFTPLGRCIQRQKDGTQGRFRTPSGRIVYGGNGIEPDVEILTDDDSVSSTSLSLYRDYRERFYQFAHTFVRSHPDVPSDPYTFVQSLTLSDSLYTAFQSTFQPPAFSPQKWLRHKKEIKHLLVIEIAGRYWGDSGRYLAHLVKDSLVQKSLGYLSTAQHLLSARQQTRN